jgi:3-hydroxybutyryl-CoA dehydrogenase
MQVGVIGAGTMGAGIAQVAAQNGNQVILFDTNEVVLDKAKQSLANTLIKLVEKNKITAEQQSAIASCIQYTTDNSNFKNCELIIEAIVENLEVKKKVFAQLETIVSNQCILATNTSSLSVTSIAAACKNSNRVVGIHFFNPAPIMALVEIIPAIQTSETVLRQSNKIISDWGKTTVVVKDTPGFIVNRIARPYYSEALRIYDEGIAEKNIIDIVMTTLGGFKMGPFALMDMIGHDVNYVVTETVWQNMYYDPKYKPSITQKRLLEAGWLGKKSGRGFYDYTSSEQIIMDPLYDEVLYHKILNRILVMLFNEAGDAVYYNIASPEDIEIAMTKGVNYPKGLLAWAKEFGHENIKHQLDELYNFYKEDRYRCSVYFNG